MNKEIISEVFLSISPNKFGIYLFDVNSFKEIYISEFIIKNNLNYKNFNLLKDFLDNNIYKIEKNLGKFIDNIFIIIESEKILSLDIGIKKKNYNKFLNRQNLENYITEVKDLFKENYPNQKIMHIIINKFLINGKIRLIEEENLECDQLNLEIQIKSLSNNVVYNLNKVLENYQIKINKFLDGNYIKSLQHSDIVFSAMAHKIINGYNNNEVRIVPKNLKKIGFFEKFFQLFS
tara:strand:+ start:687 stop:1388 length:702 start_codon:yes stop_codon:yes gene_type:complete